MASNSLILPGAGGASLWDRAALWALLLLVATTTLHALPGAVAVLLVTAVGALARLRIPWEPSPLDGPVFAFSGAVLLSALLSELQSVALSSTLPFVLSLLLGYGAAYRVVRRMPDALRLLAGAWIVGGVLTALVGGYVFFSGEGLGRLARTPALTHTITGTALALASLVALGELLAATTRRARWAAGLAAVIIFGGLIVTISRGAWAGWAAGVLAFTVICFQKVSRRSAIAVALACALAGAVMLGIGAWWLGPQIEPRHLTGRFRAEIWRTSLRIVEARPLTGIGLGTFSLVFPRYTSGLPTPFDRPPTAHNIYLHVLVETGLIGGVAFAILLASALLAGGRSVGAHRDPRALGFCSGYVAILVREVVDTTIFSFHLGMATAVLLGIMAGLTRTDRGLDGPRA